MKDLEAILREVAKVRGFNYILGEQHWQNLLDSPDDQELSFENKQKYMLYFFESERPTFGKYGPQAFNYEGTFLLSVRSSMADPDFNYKYDSHLRPLKELARELRDVDFACIEGFRLTAFDITAWRENYLDTNLDCVEIRIGITNA